MEWSAASLDFEEAQSGDGYRIVECPNTWLVAVVDALGHGREAAQAKDLALETVSQCREDTLESIFAHTHAALRTTRGAAMALARVEKGVGTVTLAAVGNVEAVLVGAEKRMYAAGRNGVVGYNLRSIRTTSYAMGRGDLLVFFTDGVNPEFLQSLPWNAPPAPTARRVLNGFAHGRDDALVLVGRK